MRTSTRFLSGLGLFTLFVSVTADNNKNTLQRRQAPPTGTFLVGSATTVDINPADGNPGTIADFAYTQQSITFTALTNSAILTISAQNDDGLFSYDDFSAIVLDDPANVNIIQNSGFETGSLLPWYSVSGSGAVVDNGAESALTGTYGLLVDTTAGQTEVIAQVLATNPNTVYTVSFSVRSVGSSNALTSVTIQSQIEPPTITGLTPETDDGVSNDDGQTSVSNPILAGISDFRTLVEITVAGAVVGTASPLLDGTFTFQLPAFPAAGSYSVTATGISTFDGTTRTPTTAPFIIVFTPAPPTISLDPAFDTGVLGDDITSSTFLQLIGTATANSVVNVFDTGNLVGTTSTNNDGTWSLFFGPVAVGTHTYRVFNVPDTYSQGPSTALIITVVTVPDPPVLIGLDPASDDGTSGDSSTTILTPDIIGTGLAGSTVVLFDGNNAEVGTGLVDNLGNFAITTTPLSLGFNSFYGQQTDINGEISGTGSTISIFILPTIPVITGIDPAVGTNGDGNPTTSSLQPSLLGTGSPGTVAQIYEDGAYVGAGDTNGDGDFSALFFAPLSLGLHTFTALSVTIDGYQSEEFSAPFTIEVVEPSASSSEALSSTVSSEISESTSADVSATVASSSVQSSSIESSNTVSFASQTTGADSSIASTETAQSTSSEASLTASSIELSTASSDQATISSTDASVTSGAVASTTELGSSSVPESDLPTATGPVSSQATSDVDVGTSLTSGPSPTEIVSLSSIPVLPTASDEDLSTPGASTMSWSNSSIASPSLTSVEIDTSVPTVLPTFQPTTEVPSTPSPTLSGSVIPTPSGAGSATSDIVTPSDAPSAPFFLVLQAPGLRKRQITSGSSYLTLVNGQLIATQSCTELPPVAFTLDNDRLAIGDSFATTTTALVADPGYSALQFQTTRGVNDIQTIFALDAVSGSLSWTNAAFLNPTTQFCLLNNVLVAAYSVSVASIPGCVAVVAVRSTNVCSSAASSSTLPDASTNIPSATGTGGLGPVTTDVSIIIGVEITIQITIVNINIVVNGVLVPTTKTETQTVTAPLTATPATSVGCSVVNGKTECFTKTVACGICQCSGAVPGEITAYKTVTVCETCKPTPHGPVETIVPCGTCQPLVPGPVHTGSSGKGGSGGNPYVDYVPAGPAHQPAPTAVVPVKSPDGSIPQAPGTVPAGDAVPAGTPASPPHVPQGEAPVSTSTGESDKTLVYTGGSSKLSASGAIFGILVGILVLFC